MLTRTTDLNEDIELIKAHQWQMTYYSLLLSAGVFGFEFTLLQHHLASSRIMSIILALLIYLSFAQILLIIAFQGSFYMSLCQYRDHGVVINNLLNDITRLDKTINATAKIKNETPQQQRDLSLFYAVIFVIFGSVGLLLTLGYSVLKLANP